MHDELPLNALLAEYQEGNIGRKELEGRIFTHIVENGERFNLRNWKQEDIIDLLCGIYSRITSAIDKYDCMGASLDAYIGTMIGWCVKEHNNRERNHRLIEKSCWTSVAVEMEAREEESEYFEQAPQEPFKPVSNPRQALILLLKSYNYVSDDFIARAAPALGIPKETLTRLVDSIRQRRLDRDEEYLHMRERIHRQYYRCLIFQKRLEAMDPSSPGYPKMQEYLKRSRDLLGRMRKRYQMVRTNASNRVVAEVLGVPKGTVDSNLSAVKSKRNHN
ncbi:MAG: hypothetical protein LBD08_03100 [Treponema sp.]|jgi:hypothetical protein|nr:hypothetical protein [Treponema sp.]